MKLGPTGKFPRGKLNRDDEGEITFTVSHDENGLVHITFGKPVAWVALPAEQAIEFAHAVLSHAGRKDH